MRNFKTRRFFRLSLIACAMLLHGQNLFAQNNTLDLAGLDDQSPASVAYSLRKLSSSYTGAAIRVRRSNDNAAMDIGFNGNGDLDVTALTTFAGANNAFVTIWYDQSGNTKNLTQTAANRQPWIVHNGVVDKENNRPFIRFYGHNGIDNITDRLDLNPEMTTTGLVSIVNKFAPHQGTEQFRTYGDGFLLGHTSSISWHSNNISGSLFYGQSLTSASILNGSVWQNGVAVAPTAAVFNTSLMVNTVMPQSPSAGTTWNNIGSDRDQYHDTNLGGGYSELIVFPAGPSSSARIQLVNSQYSYYNIERANSYLDRRGALGTNGSNNVDQFGRLGTSGVHATGETGP